MDRGLPKLTPPPAPDAALSKAELMALVGHWAARLGVTFKRVQVRPMRQKWGSISTAGSLSLAADLFDLPLRLVEYVICHELLHLKAPYHNRLYYLLLAQFIPDWRERERELGRWVVRLNGF
jgi:hypothetical protein